VAVLELAVFACSALDHWSIASPAGTRWHLWLWVTQF